MGNDSADSWSTRDIVHGLLGVVAIYWLVVAICPDEWRARFQAAGDALGAVGAMAGVGAALLVMRQLEVQNEQRRADERERRADRRRTYLRELRIAYAEWRARAEDWVFACLNTAPATLSLMTVLEHSPRIIPDKARAEVDAARATMDGVRHKIELLDEDKERRNAIADFRGSQAGGHFDAKRTRERLDAILDRIAASLDDETARLSEGADSQAPVTPSPV
jgi:hypothetical protein